ncbi:FAD-dependent oxidoreductase, partial [Kineococcus esterisolvens]|uniref:FAD-dependent oxidoreductase n=1 Tax=Kineococcus sp. SYSU DK017 TaxID=3383138 RepID=UPI003D7D5C0B
MIPSATSLDRSDPLPPAIPSGKASPSPSVPSPPLPPSADVVVVGAGLAGLACARHLSAAGLQVAVVEASDGVGGRVRSDVVDGFRVDRGFQLVNPAYPELHKVLDVAALRLQPFDAGVAGAGGGRGSGVHDPRRLPAPPVVGQRVPHGAVNVN